MVVQQKRRTGMPHMAWGSISGAADARGLISVLTGLRTVTYGQAGTYEHVGGTNTGSSQGLRVAHYIRTANAGTATFCVHSAHNAGAVIGANDASLVWIAFEY